MSRPWTKHDDERLRTLAPHYLTSIIAKKMGFAHKTVKRHAKALGLKLLSGDYGSYKPVYKHEEDYIIKSYPSLDYPDIARRLGRPTVSVMNIHKRLLREAREKEAAKKARERREKKIKEDEARRFPRTKYGYSGLLRANI